MALPVGGMRFRDTQHQRNVECGMWNDVKHIHRIPPQQQEDESHWLAKFTPPKDSGFCVPAEARLHVPEVANEIKALRLVVREWRNHFEEYDVTGKDIDAVRPAFLHALQLGMADIGIN
ncbi:hypothetical protein ACMU9U_003422 [Yersinia enterocolitica]|nr:hypothetical protein [Yersinia enterocolitica]